MINYNSIIDSYSSRTQNCSPSYSVMKKPIKVKPKPHYFHEPIHPQRSDNLCPPLIHIQKKPLNITPRRVMNIKLPNPEGHLRRNPSISPENDSFQYSSRSMDFPKAPIVFSTLKTKHRSNHSPTIYFPRPSLNPDLSQISFEKIEIHERGKSLMRHSKIPSSTKNSLFEKITTFQHYIDSTYRKMYEEIDISQKGFITQDDFINLVMFIELINPGGGRASTKNCGDFEVVKGKAEEILQLFSRVTKSNKVCKKDFYAVCSLYEFVKSDARSFSLMDAEMRQMLIRKTEDFEQIFHCYAKEGRIRMKDLHNILSCLSLSDLHQIESMLYLENIDLPCFFRYLPLFSWMHTSVIKSLDYTIQEPKIT